MPKVIDHAQRRREITRALWAVIYERGIAAVTFQAVAAEAGISVGRIQHYFSSKHDLVLAGAREMVRTAGAAWAAGEQADHDALASLIRQPIPRTEQLRLGAAVWYSYLAASIADPDLGPIVRDAIRDSFDLASGLAADVRGDGPAARALAVRLVAMGNGLAQAVLVGALNVTEALEALDAELAAAGIAPAAAAHTTGPRRVPRGSV